MDKKLILGLAFGLAGVYFLSSYIRKKSKKTDELALETDSADKQTACEKKVEEGMKSIRFINAEGMLKYRENAITECMSRKTT